MRIWLVLVCEIGCRPAASPAHLQHVPTTVVRPDAPTAPAALASASDARIAPLIGRDLVGWATRHGDKIRLELADRDVVGKFTNPQTSDQYYDCRTGRPPYAHYAIEIDGGRAKGSYHAADARSCPGRGACITDRAAVVTIESYVDETGGGVGRIEVTLPDGRLERDTIEYDFCYR